MITRLPVVDDTGDKVSGTAITADWWRQVEDMIDARWTFLSYAADPGLVHDLNVGEADVLFLQNASPLTITGIAQPANPSKPAKPIRLKAIGGPVALAFNDARSLSTSRLVNRVTSGPTMLNAGGSAEYTYVGGVWWMTNHEQGGWLSAPLSSGMFTASTGTFTPNLGGSEMRYRVAGSTLELDLRLVGASVSNAGVILYAALPSTYITAARAFPFQFFRGLDNGAPVAGVLQPGGNLVTMYTSVGGAPWQASAGTTEITAPVRLELA
jgi:hypothetical protein